MNIEILTAKSIFLEAIEKAPPDRAAFLVRACAGDQQLLDQVHKLLRSHEALGTFREAAPKLSPPALENFDQPPEQIGALVGPYKLLEQIGEGGMGLVYMAEQQRPIKRLVALKIIKPGMDTRQVIARFEAERQALAMMDHPNIAKVLDAGTTETGRPYFVMELVRGIPINEFCDQKNLSIRERLELFIQVCHAVQHAHQKGIIHRDLKPTNVLITLHDTVAVPKIIDFGIAKALGQQLTERTLHTGFAQLVGTPLYMSPEQAEMNQLGVDTRSDVYSLGVMLYELLTGTTPFDQDRLKSAGFDEMRRIIREEEPETVSARLVTTRRAGSARHSSSSPHSALRTPHLPELDWIVSRALEKDRSRRYESASALAADLQRYLADEPVLACPPSAVYRFRKFARRKQRLLATLAVISAAILVSIAALAFGYLQAKQKQQETQAALDGERQALSRERQTLYYHRIALADSSYWLANDVGQAARLLDECPAPFRHWEWNHLKRLCQTDALTLTHPNTPVYSVACTADGQRLATGARNTITIWDAHTGQQISKFRGHVGDVSGLAFSPDGKQLASAGDDQTVKLWDMETFKTVRALRGHEGAVNSAVFDPRGERLISGGQDRSVKIWDVATGEQLFSIDGHGGPVRTVAISADGQRLVSAGDDKMLRIWDAKTGKKLKTLSGPTRYVMSVAFDPSGKLVAAGGADWMARIWDVSTGRELHTLRGHRHYVSGVAFSPDGSTLATSSHDQTIKLWAVASGQELRVLRGHTHQVRQATFCPDGRLASAGFDQTAKIWDPTAPQGARTISVPGGLVHHAVFSPDGTRLATAGGDNTVRIWDAATGQQLVALEGHTWQVWGVAYSPDGKLLASAGGRRGDPDPADVKIWDSETGSELLTLRSHTRTVRRVVFSPDGQRLASASHDNTVKLWDVATGRELQSFTGHTLEVISVAFSHRGDQLASASYDKTVKLWDVATGQLVRTFTGHNNRVYDVAFTPDGQRLASVGSTYPSRLKVWDLATGLEVQDLTVGIRTLLGLAYTADGRRIVTTEYDGTVKLWDALAGREVLTLRGHTDQVWSAAFTADGCRLATASYDGTVKIWDATPLNTNDK